MSLRTANVEEGAHLDIKEQGFGGNDKQCAFSKYGFLIHSHTPIVPSPWQHATEEMNMKKEGFMINV